MAAQVAETRAPNSLLLIMDPLHGEPADDVTAALAVATRSCLTVGTLAETDGPTRAALGDEPEVELALV